MPYNIVVVDDHTLIAKAITGIIENFPRYHVLYEVEHGKAMIERFHNRKNIPDIVLLDVSMPVMDGFETAKWLKEYHPEVLVLALSMQDDELSIIKMIRAGAHGYLLKNIQPADLLTALDSLVANKVYYPEYITNKVLFTHGGEIFGKATEDIYLSEKELLFLKHSCTELTYKEIAEILSYSVRTVEGYRDALYDKLGVKSRVGLVLYAIKHGLYKA